MHAPDRKRQQQQPLNDYRLLAVLHHGRRKGALPFPGAAHGQSNELCQAGASKPCNHATGLWQQIFWHIFRRKQLLIMQITRLQELVRSISFLEWPSGTLAGNSHIGVILNYPAVVHQAPQLKM